MCPVTNFADVFVLSYAYSQIRYLSLPIPQALALFTVVLPFITGISARGTYGLVRRSSNSEPYQLTIPLIAVIGFQLIYETIVATLALTYILPPSTLQCGLETKWTQLFRVKDGVAIRAIQDAFNCCGLNSVRDKSWPFTQPATCADTFHRSQSCVAEWRKAEQVNASLLLLVALTVFIIKVRDVLHFGCKIISRYPSADSLRNRSFPLSPSLPVPHSPSGHGTSRGSVTIRMNRKKTTGLP